MTMTAKAKERMSRSIPRAVINASWDTISASRPVNLDDRVLVYAALCANSGLDESADMLHCLAFLDELLIPGNEPTITFQPKAGVFSLEVEASINRLIRDCQLQHGKQEFRETDWVEPLHINPEAFDHAYEARWTAWGFAMWQHVEGLMDVGSTSISNDKEIERVGVDNSARDLGWVITSLCMPGVADGRTSYREWDGKDVPGTFKVKPIYDALEATKNEDGQIEQIRPTELAWYLGRYLAVRTARFLADDIDFGNRRYLRVQKTLTSVAGTDPSGTCQSVTFFKGEEIVGRLTYREEFVTLQGFGGPRQQGEHHLLTFEVDPAFRQQGIGQVMIRHAMCLDVRHVPADLAKTLTPLMCRHGVKQDDGSVRLARVNWGRVKGK